MKPEAGALASLTAVIRHDLAAAERMHSELAPLAARLEARAEDFRDLAALAYLFHNLYNALENTFEHVSRTFENHVTDPSRWHREVLDKMFLEIPDWRPAVLPDGLRQMVMLCAGRNWMKILLFRVWWQGAFHYRQSYCRRKRPDDNWMTKRSRAIPLG